MTGRRGRGRGRARDLDPAGGADKYDNPSRRLGTNPRIRWTIPTGRPRPGLLVVTEGIPDALTASQAGYTTAANGSQAPDTSVAARLATRADRDQVTIVAVVDGDPAGQRWGQRLGELLAEHAHTPTAHPAAAGQRPQRLGATRLDLDARLRRAHTGRPRGAATASSDRHRPHRGDRVALIHR